MLARSLPLSLSPSLPHTHARTHMLPTLQATQRAANGSTAWRRTTQIKTKEWNLTGRKKENQAAAASVLTVGIKRWSSATAMEEHQSDACTQICIEYLCTYGGSLTVLINQLQFQTTGRRTEHCSAPYRTNCRLIGPYLK